MNVFFKQYGEQRTGTNYIKHLIELNFHNSIVFASVLGWKHGLYEIGNGYQCTCTSHEEWLKRQHRNGIVYSVDGHPLKFNADFLRSALGQLNYIVSMRDIYQWLYSYKQFRYTQVPWAIADAKRWCERYIQSYLKWVELLEENGGTVIHHSSLLIDCEGMLTSFEKKFNLSRKSAQIQNEMYVVRASTDLGINLSNEIRINTKAELERLKNLPPAIAAVVDGYLPEVHQIIDRLKPFELPSINSGGNDR